MSQIDAPFLFFENQSDWRQWLEKNHATINSVWLKFYKKGSGVKTLVYAEALDEALCFGWIDGMSKSIDEKCYKQYFTPRRPRSVWSKQNTEHIARLTKLGKMHPSGIRQVELAKADGRWDQAYSSPQQMEIPEDFMKELKKDKKAYEFFLTLNKTNKYFIGFQLQTAKKTETKERRMKKILDQLKKAEKFH